MPKHEYLQHLNNYRWFITIDIGSRIDGGTGIAIFSHKQKFPVDVKFINSPLKDWQARCNHICYTFKNWFLTFSSREEVPKVFIENPKFFESHIGLTAARSDSLYKLIVLFGRIYEICFQSNASIIPVEISHWKGQIPKNIMQRRIESITGEKYNSDVCDAVGLGLYLKGLINVDSN